MQYSERYSDRECQQTYQELVHNSMSHHAGGEAQVVAELLSRQHAVNMMSTVARPGFSRFRFSPLDWFCGRFLTPQS